MYAPYSSASSLEEISSLRANEDVCALRILDSRIKVVSLGLLDAPIRLNTTLPGLSAPDNEQLLVQGEIECLTQLMQPYFGHRLILSPLSLGNHIDHKAVRLAALKGQSGQRLGFYEDLPYASWTSTEDLHDRITEAEEATLLPLRPVIIRNSKAQAKKFRAVTSYRSQIDRNMAKLITNFSNRYAKGERIWIPRHSRFWNRLCC